MKKIINTQNIQTFIQQIPTVTNQLQNVSQIMKQYVECLEQNKMITTTKETYQEEYERKEGILKKEGELDKLEMTMKQREEVTNKSIETIEILPDASFSCNALIPKSEKLSVE